MQQDYKTEMRAMTEGLAEWCRRRERQRQRATRTLIGAAAVVAVIAIAASPDPDGHYISDPQARTETLHNIDQTLLASI
ncbi:MAG: hypothetical protein IKX32_00365 [Bacteroidales bacterium]|nr:hypothetical protein [Bacteroidales bacterium]